jgi:hypothetical protein
MMAASALLVCCPTPILAEVELGLYNPVNHGLITFSDNEPLNEFSADRVGVAHATFKLASGDFYNPPFYVDREIISFFQANPDGLPDIPSDPDGAEFWEVAYNIWEGSVWEVENFDLPGRSAYGNVRIFPSAPEAKLGLIENWGYFDPMVRRSSSTAGSGLSANGGQLTLTSPKLDTGFGEARGRITPDGDIKLQVEVNRSGGQGFTPVAEAAIQGYVRDSFTIDLAQAEPVSARLSVAAKASIPTLDFNVADLYSYAVGYQFAILEPITFGETEAGQFLLSNPDFGETIAPEFADLPVIREHWGASGLYWADARRKLTSSFLDEYRVTIESIGLTVPDMPGVAESQAPVEFFRDPDEGIITDIPVAFKDIREFTYNTISGEGRFYDDPLMPFNEFKEVENVLLPTNKPLIAVMNFFVMAGASDGGFPSNAPVNFSIDGGNSAGFGISIDDPAARIISSSVFEFRPVALGVPETSSLHLIAGSIVTVVVMARQLRRRAG